MKGRLGKTTRHPVMKVMIDFNNVGYARKDEWADITDDILEISGSKEKSGRQIGSISSDITTFTTDNTHSLFSNDNKNSPFYKKIKSNLKFRLLTGFQGEKLVPYASGYVEAFTPSWLDKKILIKTTDYFKLFKEKDVPEDSYQDISWDALVNILCVHVDLPDFIVKHIPKTEFHYNYFKFEEENCFEALKGLLEIAVGEAYFEQEEFFVKTKLALDYQLDTAVDHDITVDDMFEFEENVDGDAIINKLSISSEHKTIGPLEVVFETPENIVKVENEQKKYLGGNYVFTDVKNLPLINNDENPITLKNLTQGRTIYINGHDPLTGRITVHPDSLAYLSTNDSLALSYSYQQLALIAGQERKYTLSLSDEIESLHALDIAVWDKNGEIKMKYSESPNTPNTVSKQSMSYNKKDNTIILTLRNNYNDPITISTLQFRGYPIKVISPIEVHIKDLPSIEEFGTKETSISNNYLNNVKLAEKIGQYIIDNNKKNRKRINIEIAGYPEFTLDDISKISEASSGTAHKFTNERIDFTFNPDNGWTVRTSLVELDSAPWVYESFKGESWEKTNPGTPDSDFIKDINANLVKNGGAELYTGFSDIDDIQAIAQKHIVPDYWRFVRTLGNASARIRDGGNLVLHGLHSFEITTTNSGVGHFEQIINGVKPSAPHLLSFVASVDSCSGKASVEQYNGNVMVQSNSVNIPASGVFELMINSLATTTAVLIKIEKLAGSKGIESLVFDKVKFENSRDRTPYIESEETSAVQVGQRYANSVTIGNQYGIQVVDQNGRDKVKMGQYEPGKYGMKVYGGAIEIEGGLPEEQIDPEAAGRWNNTVNYIEQLSDDSKIIFDERTSIKDKMMEIVGIVLSDTASMPTISQIETSGKGEFFSVRLAARTSGIVITNPAYISVETGYNRLKTYLEGLTFKPWDTSDGKKGTALDINPAAWREAWLAYYTAIEALRVETTKQLRSESDLALKKGTLYNGIKIDTAVGFMATRSDNKSRVRMNATEGIIIEKSADGSSWSTALTADTYGNIVMTSGVISWGNVNPPSASQIGARPANWTPTASEVGARPDYWVPSASDIGALSAASSMLTHISSNGVYTGSVTASQITGGTIRGITIQGGTFTSSDGNTNFSVQGGYMRLAGSEGTINVTPSGIQGYNANGSLKYSVSSDLINSTALGASNKNVYTATRNGGELRVCDMANIPSDGDRSSYYYRDVRCADIYTRGVYIGDPQSTYGFSQVATQSFVTGKGYMSSLPNYSITKVFYAEGDGSNWLVGDAVDSLSSNNHIYLRGNSVKCTANGKTGTYVNCLALNFNAQSDVRVKTNLKSLNIEDAYLMLDNTPIYEYYLKDELEKSVYSPEIGTLTQAAPVHLQSSEGTGINIYSMASLNTRVIQEHRELLKKREVEEQNIYMVLEVMIDDNDKKTEEIKNLQSQIDELKQLILTKN